MCANPNPADLFARHGVIVQLDCKIRANPANISFTWTHTTEGSEVNNYAAKAICMYNKTVSHVFEN